MPANAELRRLASDYFAESCRRGPTEAHLIGRYEYAPCFEDVSRAAEERDVATLRRFAASAADIDPAGLDGDDRVTRDTLIFDARSIADVARFGPAEFTIDPISGLTAMLPVVVPQFGVPDAEVAEAMVAKFHAIAAAYRDQADRLVDGVDAGRTPVDFAVKATVSQLEEALAQPIADDPLLAVDAPPDLDAGATAAWRERLAAALADSVRPAMGVLLEALRGPVAAAARPDEAAGATALPDGDAYYAATVRRYTTLDLDPRDIHRVGLDQIERLSEEYRELAGPVLGTTELDGIFSRLRDDPELRHRAGADVISACEVAFDRARAGMATWFGRLPSVDCNVEPTESGPLAFYFAPATDGSRPGTFFMNTGEPSRWGRFEIECTSFHEGIPGHHLQIGIAQELGDAVPEFRRHNYIAAFSEGWGLYSERLADEMGLYSGPMERIGMLAADSMRACRLVVDTGLHALGWSRQRAVDYMVANSPLAVGAVRAEIDRYVCDPGQALSYMVGRIEIERLRTTARGALGDRFDIREFHDTVLGSGDVPLPVLRDVVNTWLAGA